MITLLLTSAISYLLGSMPSGYLLVRIFRGEDVRLSGSGNIGATNVSRQSPALGAITLLLDALKGTLAVTISRISAGHMGKSPQAIEAMALAALFAIIGHIFPVWLNFRGGKGVATGLGSFALIAPKAVVIAVGIFILVAAGFRYVSLGSILSVATFPFVAWRLAPQLPAKALILVALASLLIVAKHHQNIRRLLAGTENRIRSKRA